MSVNFFFKALVLVALSSGVSGCYFKYASGGPHVERCRYHDTGEQVVEHLFVENYGWYLFGTIPLFCGDTDESSRFPLTFFDDQCNTDVLRQRFNEHVAQKGLEARGISVVNSDVVTFDVPGFAFPVIIPYIICARDIQISGTLVKKEVAQ